MGALCDDVDNFLTLWDSLLSSLLVEYPKEGHCTKAQQFINWAIAKMRSLEMSTTVKGHGSEDRIVGQTREAANYDGLSESDK